jgi:hypothetical protein
MPTTIKNSAVKRSIVGIDGNPITAQPTNNISVVLGKRSGLNGDGSIQSAGKRPKPSRTIIIGNTRIINASANLGIASGATSPNRAVNRRKNLRINATLAGDRFYDYLTGKFSAPGLTFNPTSHGLATDKAIATPGRVTFNIGARTPTSANV